VRLALSLVLVAGCDLATGLADFAVGEASGGGGAGGTAAGGGGGTGAGAGGGGGGAGGSGSLQGVLESLSPSLLVELPCGQHAAEFCETTNPPNDTRTVFGAPATTYQVTFRFAGVVELNEYTDGGPDGNWYAGGYDPDGLWNIFRFEISVPAQTFFVNHGVTGPVCVAVDFEQTVLIASGATVTLSADDRGDDSTANYDNASVGNVSVTEPFDGEFFEVQALRAAVVQ
jgi:hypothetical protein